MTPVAPILRRALEALAKHNGPDPDLLDPNEHKYDALIREGWEALRNEERKERDND